MISTHSARGGGDAAFPLRPLSYSDFNPLRPWGRRRQMAITLPLPSRFQPTPPVGAETPLPFQALSWRFNFNPLRPWGRRLDQLGLSMFDSQGFQPAPPVGAETGLAGHLDGQLLDFNPLRPWGRRRAAPVDKAGDVLEFQPAPPVGAETRRRRWRGRILLISTRSARGGGDSIVSAQSI